MVADLKYFDGSLAKIDRVPAELRELYATAFEVDAKWIVEAGARRQKWIDQAQSLNIYMAGASGKKLDETYKLAWLRGLKTTYYLRTLAATSAEKSTGKGGELNAVSSGGTDAVSRQGRAPSPSRRCASSTTRRAKRASKRDDRYGTLQFRSRPLTRDVRAASPLGCTPSVVRTTSPAGAVRADLLRPERQPARGGRCASPRVQPLAVASARAQGHVRARRVDALVHRGLARATTRRKLFGSTTRRATGDETGDAQTQALREIGARIRGGQLSESSTRASATCARAATPEGPEDACIAASNVRSADPSRQLPIRARIGARRRAGIASATQALRERLSGAVCTRGRTASAMLAFTATPRRGTRTSLADRQRPRQATRFGEPVARRQR